MSDWSRTFYWTPEFVGEINRVEAALARRLQNGDSASVETYNEELRKWEALPETRSLFTPYFRAQACYVLIYRSEVNGYPIVNHDVPTEILAAWGRDIARDGLEANVIFPDDRKMRKTLSRPFQTTSRLWEEQGHRHQSDSLSLLERIYTVHEQLKKEAADYERL